MYIILLVIIVPSVERILNCNVIQNLAEDSIHCHALLPMTDMLS